VAVDGAAAVEGGEGSVRPGEGSDESWLAVTTVVEPCCARGEAEPCELRDGKRNTALGEVEMARGLRRKETLRVEQKVSDAKSG